MPAWSGRPPPLRASSSPFRPGWGNPIQPRRHALAAGEAVSGGVTVNVTRVGASGMFRVTLAVTSGSESVASTDAVVELLESPVARSALGPKVVAGMASVLA